MSSIVRTDDIPTWGWRYRIGVLLSVGIAAINLYVGYVAAGPPMFAVGCSFLVGVGLFFTRFWNPVLYLLGVLHIGVLGVIWILSGLQFLAIGLVNGVLSLGLAAIALSLFFEEERSIQR
ncbi:hypothetical protein [Halorubrum sp. DTA98]|uniref:hypothetical protein n=1 Tax=Halorubrum sp. DTA98 TaxID=3402163 RepID=UPI003AAECF3B